MADHSSRGRPPHPDILTPAEWRVANGVRHGLTNREIAERQGVSVDAVKYHTANVLQKLGFKNRAQLRAWDGAPVDSALHQERLPMETNLSLGAIGQISRKVSDIEKARAWYQNILGIPHLYSLR